MIQYKYNSAKATASVLYISQKLIAEGLDSDFHKMFKILYDAERTHLIDWGRPIIGDTYIRMTDGPVPSKLYDDLKAERRASSDETPFTVEGRFIVIPTQDPDMDEFSDSDIEYIDNSIKENKSEDFGTLSRKFHDLAWRAADPDSPMSWSNIAEEAGASQEEIETLALLSESDHISL